MICGLNKPRKATVVACLAVLLAALWTTPSWSQSPHARQGVSYPVIPAYGGRRWQPTPPARSQATIVDSRFLKPMLVAASSPGDATQRPQSAERPSGFQMSRGSVGESHEKEQKAGFQFSGESGPVARRQPKGEPLQLTIDGSSRHGKRSTRPVAEGFTFVEPDTDTDPHDAVLAAEDSSSQPQILPLKSLTEDAKPLTPYQPTVQRRNRPSRPMTRRTAVATSRPPVESGRVTIVDFGVDSEPADEPGALREQQLAETPASGAKTDNADANIAWWIDEETVDESAAATGTAADQQSQEFWMPTGERFTAQTPAESHATDNLMTVGLQMLLLPISPEGLIPAAKSEAVTVAATEQPTQVPPEIFMPAEPGPEIVYTNMGLAKPESAASLQATPEGLPTGPLRPSGPTAAAIQTAELTASQVKPAEHWTEPGHVVIPGMDDSYVQVGALLDDDLRSLDADPLLPLQGDESTDSSTINQADDARAPGEGGSDQTLGEEPEQSNQPLQFLRRQTILLEPGEFQFDIGLNYLNDTNDFSVLQVDDMGDVVGVLEAKTRQRLLTIPMELRAGVTEYTQAFVNVPFGWAHSEVAFNAKERTKEEGGIGDISAGLTQQIVIGNEYYPDVLASVAFSAPTGNSSVSTALSTPGSGLGQGFWTLTGSLAFIQSYDPVVIFYGVGYTYRFESTFANVIEIDPGNQVFYRLGAGFAVNPHVTLSASFVGSVIAKDEVNGFSVGGSIREPMQLRLAATISQKKSSKMHKSFKLIEPFVNFGLNDDSIDALIGITWTH